MIKYSFDLFLLRQTKKKMKKTKREKKMCAIRWIRFCIVRCDPILCSSINFGVDSFFEFGSTNLLFEMNKMLLLWWIFLGVEYIELNRSICFFVCVCEHFGWIVSHSFETTHRWNNGRRTGCCKYCGATKIDRGTNNQRNPLIMHQ